MKHKGISWEEGFCDGLVRSRIFIPLLSRGGLHNFTKLQADSNCDNVLLEYNLALELRERGLVEFIYPIMIGDCTVDAALGEVYGEYFRGGCYPDLTQNGECCVDSVCAKLTEHLSRLALGSMLLEKLSIGAILYKICINQGNFIQAKR